MGYAKKCTRCGAYLDPWERNDPCDDCIEELRKQKEAKEKREAKELAVLSERNG